jgi:hypothetical protein
MAPLESHADRLWLCLSVDEKSVFLEDAMAGSPGTWEINRSDLSCSSYPSS